MSFPITFTNQARKVVLLVCPVVLLAGGAVGWAAPVTPSPPAPVSGKSQDISMEAYWQHLTALDAVVEACAKARDLKTCDPALVGPNDRVPVVVNGHAERRLIRFDWLRILLARAQEADQPQEQPAKGKKPADASDAPARPTTSQLLVAARTRLAYDLKESKGNALSMSGWAAERATLRQVLAGKEFKDLQGETVRDSVLERLNRWLNKLFAGMARWRPQSAWVGRAIVIGFVLVVCVGLVWGLLQFERRWRLRLVPETDGPGVGAASARDWQLWLEDARRAAAEGRWREAIHFVYWSAISRLESKRLWPADRARTPREYLALVAEGDPRKAGLAQLTRSFERTWYGGRMASQGEYEHAEALATGLIGQAGAGYGAR